MPGADQAPFRPDQSRTLRALVGRLIPASAEFGVPGADDETIFADILTTLQPDTGPVSVLLHTLAADAGGDFPALPAADRDATYQARMGDPGLVAAITATLLCYYRDDRVMVSLGMEPRPPFPKGFEVEEGDWSLLDPVRARPRLWRDAPP